MPTRTILMLFAVCLLIPVFSQAQKMKKHEWKEYQIEFSLPERWNIQHQNADELYAFDPHTYMSVRIHPWKNPSQGAREVAYHGYETYTQTFNKVKLSEEAILMPSGSDFHAYGILGKGIQSNRSIFFAVLGLIHPKSPVNLYVRFAWIDVPTENNKQYQLAEKIGKTFKMVPHVPKPEPRLKDWFWKEYNLQFKLPINWVAKSQTAHEIYVFEPVTGMSIRIHPWNNPAQTAKSTAEYAYHSYDQTMNKAILEQAEIEMPPASGFKAYGIMGTGFQQNRRIYFGILGLINPSTTTNIYVRFAWWDVPGQNEKFYQKAVRIGTTFKIWRP